MNTYGICCGQNAPFNKLKNRSKPHRILPLMNPRFWKWMNLFSKFQTFFLQTFWWYSKIIKHKPLLKKYSCENYSIKLYYFCLFLQKALLWKVSESGQCQLSCMCACQFFADLNFSHLFLWLLIWDELFVFHHFVHCLPFLNFSIRSIFWAARSVFGFWLLNDIGLACFLDCRLNNITDYMLFITNAFLQIIHAPGKKRLTYVTDKTSSKQ